MLVPTFTCLGYDNEGPQIGWLRTTNFDYLTVLEARSRKSRCQQGCFLLWAPRGGSAPCLCLSFLWWWFAGTLLYSSACRGITLISAFIFHGIFSLCVCFSAQMPPIYKDTSHIGLGPTLITSSWLTNICHNFIYILGYQRLGLKHLNFRGDTIWPITDFISQSGPIWLLLETEESTCFWETQFNP